MLVTGVWQIGRTELTETFKKLIKVGAVRQFTVSKAHQRKAPKR